MNRQIRSMMAAVLALLVIVSLLGCQTEQAAPATQPPAAATKAPAAPSTAPTAAPAALEALKVGYSIGLSGPAAANGIAQQRFLKMAADDLSAKGGIKAGGKAYRFEGISFDDKQTSEGGRAAADQLVLSEKVRFMIGGGGTAGGALPITEPNKVLLFIVAGQDSMLGPTHPYSFGGAYPHSRMRLPALYAQLVKDNPNAKRVALIYDDTAIGKPAALLAQEAAKSVNLTVATTEYYPTDIKDFGPLITRVLTQNPDAIDIGSAGANPPTFLAIMKALAEQGYKKPMFGLSGSASALQQAGPAAEGYFYTGIADVNSSALTTAEKDLIQRYIKTYGEAELQVIPMGAYSFLTVLAQAIEKANTVDDADKLAKTLREGTWDTIWGKEGFSGVKTLGLASYLDLNVYLSKYQGGKLITFDSFKGTLP